MLEQAWRATKRQAVDVVLNYRHLPLLGRRPLVLLALLGTLDSTNLRTRAGVMKPLLQLLQPSVDNRLADQRRTPAAQAIDREWVSETLIRETSRSGQEWSMLTELLGGQIGDIPTW